MQTKHLLAATALAVVGVTSANATLVPIATNGAWNVFDVAPEIANDAGLGWIDISDGTALSFSFTVAAGNTGTLTVVDAGFSGDRFSVFSNSAALAVTSAAVNNYPNSTFDFDLALAATNYSRGIYALAAGNYTVTGSLFSSALDEFGAPLNSTTGALRVDVAPVAAVPLPAAALLLLNGLGVFGFAARRRAAR